MGARVWDRGGPRLAAWALLLAVFFLNYVETAVEDRLHDRPVSELGTRVALAFSEIESVAHLDGVFAHHEASGPIAVYGYSISYFFVFPLLSLGLAAALTLRPDGRHLLLLARALAIDYAVSLPFFIFFPIPERWAYADSGATLLSDRWSAALIEALRPMSGLDNCFPSFHVSMSVVLAAVALLAAVRFRYAVAALALTVVVSTFGLGIHWLPDVVAGAAVGILSVALALRLEKWGRRHTDVGQRSEPARGAVPTAA
jgi:membrane-associated phospholipid phosphatase